ncbi:hypothetical protein SODALDRAFT_322209 [Sodiomyces alkalinus F11]|uniref:Uncharacterized protein n=1 Tax=Sodiomyces alkalinus (strain CBS 110278 / VKM F-3762 / F11) TaxID=1314773 RepID=A0A3N2Q2S0_SODAK|nr:hypothetical protein SODALDRAFT_322209 [Sodiomyces alkalinus F11]ROT40968.1 hypothetical protein SODALDRAFT_322209 [Sodiomyces alkalinus F11]
MSPHPSTGSSHRSSGSSYSGGSGSRHLRRSLQELIDALLTHRVNTLTELCRIEKVAAACERAEETQAFQEPMTLAWNYYVTSNQFLMELQGLTRAYPFHGDIVHDAHMQVRSDPDSNRSWNLAWLILTKIKEENLISEYAALEANKPEMWGGRDPSPQEAQQLRMLFEDEWTRAVNRMLRHWTSPPTWY